MRTIYTPLGVRTLYESVCFCNRCAMCAPVCPAYHHLPRETSSPRARNQALRLILERKIDSQTCQQGLKDLVTSCTLCGRCMQSCPGQINTPLHMLALRRGLHQRVLPRTLTVLLRFRQKNPKLFAFFMQIGLFLHRIGLVWLAAYLSGSAWLKHACQIVPRGAHPAKGLDSQTRPTLIYLPSMETQFLLPDVANSVYQTARKKHRVTVWKNTSSGLFEYAYADLQRSRILVRKLILRHHQCGGGKLPLLTDSIDVYNFLKQVPQLFKGSPRWQQKAASFAKHVKFITDILPPKPNQTKTFKTPVLLMDSALLPGQENPPSQPAEILQTLFRKNFVKCGYRDPIIYPFGYGFIKHTHAPAYGFEAAQTVLHYQAQTVFVLSGLAALELGFAVLSNRPGLPHRITKRVKSCNIFNRATN